MGLGKTAHAEMISETVSDISVPGEVLWGVQGEWQGHIIYEVTKTATGYRAKVVRDGEPHQYPYFYLEFNSDWSFVGRSATIVPTKEKPRQPEATPTPLPQEQPRPVEPTPRPETPPEEPPEEDPDEPENPGEQPPVVKPPEEEPPEEDEDEET